MAERNFWWSGCAKSPPNTPALNPAWRGRSLHKPITSKPTRIGCNTRSFGNKGSSWAPASSKPVASPSSAYASSNPACSGPYEEPTPSSLCAAPVSIRGLRISGQTPAPPDPPGSHFYVAHPTTGWLEKMKALPKLEKLTVQGCDRVNDDSIRALAALPGLRQVDLKGSAVTEKGLAALKAARPEIRVYFGPWI